ncbi:M28 family peptidase [candidate division WOR-3 bacterium]|nr:M28 family peptidase [candidate division WOR-3 bacterium]
MRMMTAVALLAAGSVVFAGESFLVRVDRSFAPDPAGLAGEGFEVVAELEEATLVRAGVAELDRLEAEFGAVVLDRDPESRLYLYAMPRGGFPPARLAEFGRVLFEDAGNVLLATSEDRVLEMNRLPVELARIRMRPLVFDRLDGGPPPLPAVGDSLVWDLVGAVSQDSVLGTIQRLEDFVTRYSTHDSCFAAVEWVRARFEEYGCDTTYLFPFRNGYAPNAVGIRRGTVNPQRIYVIGGHTDATSNQVPNRCPGSDDNASGTTAVLEAARVFQGVEFENTVMFIGFAGEEQGLYGSDSFAEFCHRRGDSIKAMLNFDMISYGRESRDSLDVIGKSSNPACGWLVDHYIAQADTFTTLKTKRSVSSYIQPNSDHYSFIARGYPALMGIERDFTPKYHTIGDTIGPLYYVNCGTNNWPMATEATRAAVASIAKLAGAYQPTGVEESPARGPARITGVEPAIGRGPFVLRLSRPAGPAARLEVFDATGRSVRELAAAGLRSVTWDGTDGGGLALAPGIYLLRLADGAGSATAKAVLSF